MVDLKRIAPGYYVVERSDEERRQAYSLTPHQVKDLLAPVKSRAIAEEITRRYERATRPSSDK